MNLVPMVIASLLIAFFIGSESLFYLAYALIGILVLSRIWTHRSLAALRVERGGTRRAFHGEHLGVELAIVNRGYLPVLWLHLHESLPIALHAPNFERRVVSLGPRERIKVRYEVYCARRGYYHLGPLQLRTGDLLGLMPEVEGQVASDPLIVYPRIVPLDELGFPSQLPFGNMASQQRIFEDPSRFFGVRDYASGDSMRAIHWKSSARSDQLQVKRFQPAIALQTSIFLDLNADAYQIHSRPSSVELGIVAAASIAGFLIEQRQQVGLGVLGADAEAGTTGWLTIPAGHGREHLMRILEALARAEAAPASTLATLLPSATTRLGWGSTAVLIVPGEQPGLRTVLAQMRRRGLNVVLVATDPLIPFASFQNELKHLSIQAYQVTRERDMDIWR